MDTTGFIVLLIFSAFVIWHSYEIWTKPDAFLKGKRSIRSRLYKSQLGFLFKIGYAEELDKNPKTELWLARFGFVVLYGFIIFGLYSLVVSR